MSSLESAYFTIEKLVKNFQANEKYYISHEYSEIDARRDFIDKFFIALGWDIYHDVQKNPYEQEVKVEKSGEREAASKRADYAFFLTPNFRDPVFYVEAKKPSRDLTNQDYYFQAIRYGWNANNPIVVLTDFEEFHVIDSRYKPDIKKVLNYTLQKYHYLEYLDKEKFNKIYYLFSREAIADNSLGKYAETLKKVKGKTIQKGVSTGVYKSIDESFLEELDEIRNTLAKGFKKSNPDLESEALTEATQRTIDRLVFIRFLEDKLILGESYISKYQNKTDPWKSFISDCRSLDAKYNGIVFKDYPLIDSNTFTPPFKEDFIKICNELSHDKSPYDFNSIPINILGSIYERFLGKIVHVTPKRVTIEEKPEVRKAGGVYYTPQYIVKYIVDNTVGKIIDGKSPKEISKLRFADISCGSGSFLITVFDTLLQYYGKWYHSNPEQAKKDGCILKNDEWILSLNQKKNILLNNIYGVDIDYQAVEVTQLSLYLKLLEDETLSSANDMQVLFKEKILPDLSKNIICGNSLIGTDIINMNTPLLAKEGTQGWSDQERKINPMNFEDAFPGVMKNGGFDAIVGNPPWGVDFKEFELEYLRNVNHDIIVRMIDSFMYFIYKSTKLLNKRGLFGMILPDVILYQKDNFKLRKYLLDNTSLLNIINLGNGVFKKVTRPTCIMLLNAGKNFDNHVLVKDLSNSMNKEDIIIKETFNYINQSKFFEIPDFSFITSNIDSYDILKKVHSVPNLLLENFVDEDGIQRGVSPDLKEAFIVSPEIINQFKLEKDFIKKVVTGGRQVKRYNIIDDNMFLIYTGRNTKFSNIPNICKYINQFKDKITCVEVKQKKHSIYSLHRAREEKIFLKDKKILGVITEDEIIVSTDYNKLYATDGIYLFTTKDVSEKYLLGILNSKLFVFLYRLISLETGRVLAQVKPTVISKLPIRKIDFSNDNEKSQHDKMIVLVTQMLESKKQLMNSKTDHDKTYFENKCNSLDRQIDQLVYELYGLTEDEIKIVEGRK